MIGSYFILLKYRLFINQGLKSTHPPTNKMSRNWERYYAIHINKKSSYNKKAPLSTDCYDL